MHGHAAGHCSKTECIQWLTAPTDGMAVGLMGSEDPADSP